MPEPGAERRTPRDGVLDLAAHRITELGVDQPVEDAVLDAQRERHRPGILRLRPGDRRGGRGPFPPASALASAEL